MVKKKQKAKPRRDLKAEMLERQKVIAQRVLRGSKATGEILVCDACGVFGWLWPWAMFKTFSPPIVPTRDYAAKPHIYVYSVVGQLGVYDPTPTAPSSNPSLSIDQFINWDSKIVDWIKVADAIKLLHSARARYQQGN